MAGKKRFPEDDEKYPPGGAWGEMPPKKKGKKKQ